MTAETFVKKKTNENVKEELSVSSSTETIKLISNCKEIIRTQHKRVIQYIYKQREILKMFKKSESFFDNAEQSRSTLPSSYFRSNVKTIRSACKKYSSLFSKEIADKND